MKYQKSEQHCLDLHDLFGEISKKMPKITITNPEGKEIEL